jgi:hypothetical protein
MYIHLCDSIRQHIRWKPTSPWKLCKLQSEPHDIDPTESLEEVGGVICKSTFANHPSHLPWISQTTPPTSHEFSLGSRSCGLDWSFHSLHGGWFPLDMFSFNRQHIRWKPTSPLCKLQSEPHDVDPTESLEEVGGVICKRSDLQK